MKKYIFITLSLLVTSSLFIPKKIFAANECRNVEIKVFDKVAGIWKYAPSDKFIDWTFDEIEYTIETASVGKYHISTDGQHEGGLSDPLGLNSDYRETFENTNILKGKIKKINISPWLFQFTPHKHQLFIYRDQGEGWLPYGTGSCERMTYEIVPATTWNNYIEGGCYITMQPSYPEPINSETPVTFSGKSYGAEIQRCTIDIRNQDSTTKLFEVPCTPNGPNFTSNTRNFNDGAYTVRVNYWNPGFQMFQCETKFIVDPYKGGQIKPTDTPIPTPTDAPFCDRYCLRTSDCTQEVCSICSICHNLSPTPIANLKPICDIIREDSEEQKKLKQECIACLGQTVDPITREVKYPNGKIWTAIGCVPTDIPTLIKEYILYYGIGIAGGGFVFVLSLRLLPGAYFNGQSGTYRGSQADHHFSHIGFAAYYLLRVPSPGDRGRDTAVAGLRAGITDRYPHRHTHYPSDHHPSTHHH